MRSETDAGITPQSIVRELDDAFLRDIRDAFEHLADGGLLYRDGDSYRRASPDPVFVPGEQQVV
ncbi:MAG: hypothetical protein WEF86_11470 [Gemmatimonadota bacterium]